ncbi:MAG: peptidoglycan-associated lipoprotein Pal [Nitrospira sp.]|nr:peptidoglycan-associated lipoprotein Pal [Nitrospira sp.]
MTAKVTGRLFLGMLALTVAAGCTGKRVTTAVEGQTVPSAPAPQTSVPSEAGRPSGEAPRAAAPSAEEGRVVQEPIVAATPSQPIQPGDSASPPSSLQEPQSQAALMDIYFDYDQHIIRGDAQSVLEANAAWFKAGPDRTVVIEGHCDERGTSAYNLVLGERRAAAAKRYLQDLGVAPSRIKIASYGKERPFCTEHSEACWQSNRRAHFRMP